MAVNLRPTADPIAPWRALLLAHSRALRAIEADLAAARVIPLTWYDVLLELRAATGPLRMQVLAERVVLSRTRVSRLVQELEVAGLVARSSDPRDGRSTLAAITDAGVTALRKAAPVYLAGIERHFTRHLTAAQRQAVATGLMRVADAHAPGGAESG
ncbi:MAG: MarR family winged helix-turn-helix transcriptional regulator [Actinomycetota bacterium]